MSGTEIEFYEAGIKDANDHRKIVVPCMSKRYEELSRKHHLQIGKLSIKCLDAFIIGVAYEINRQARLEF